MMIVFFWLVLYPQVLILMERLIVVITSLLLPYPHRWLVTGDLCYSFFLLCPYFCHSTTSCNSKITLRLSDSGDWWTTGRFFGELGSWARPTEFCHIYPCIHIVPNIYVYVNVLFGTCSNYYMFGMCFNFCMCIQFQRFTTRQSWSHSQTSIDKHIECCMKATCSNAHSNLGFMIRTKT